MPQGGSLNALRASLTNVIGSMKMKPMKAAKGKLKVKFNKPGKGKSKLKIATKNSKTGVPLGKTPHRVTPLSKY